MYKYYKIARDRAWQCLIETNINALPINLSQVLDYYHIKIKSFSSNDKQAFIENNSIFLNTQLIKTRARFTVAHELGHILLNHKNLSHSIHSESDNKNIGLLMPAIVLKEINYIEAQDIADACNVSLQSARYRAERMQELLRRDKFNLSPLERQVYNNFKDFINSNKI